jgi:Uma2 family endonuclease
MPMQTVLKIGPKDHGKAVDYDEFMAAKFAPGFSYEIIDGRVYVLPLPNPPENRVEIWLLYRLAGYSDTHPEVTNYVTNKSRIFVPGRVGATVPEPDIAAFRDYPLDLPFNEVRWEDLKPILVAEIMAGDDMYKDAVRNVELYLQVPSIKEYWLFDARANPEQPTLTVHRRHGSRWVIREYGYGDVYTTRLLPGFTLKVDPRSR